MTFYFNGCKKFVNVKLNAFQLSVNNTGKMSRKTRENQGKCQGKQGKNLGKYRDFQCLKLICILSQDKDNYRRSLERKAPFKKV